MKRRDRSNDVGENGSIVKMELKKQCRRLWTEFIWFKEHESSGSINDGEFLNFLSGYLNLRWSQFVYSLVGWV
jgi:hypothetical protein